MSEIWCLKIVVAYPDYGNPYVGVSVNYYKDKENAEKELRRRKEEFMVGWEDNAEYPTDLTDEEIFNDKFNRYCSQYYDDRCQMGQPAFEGEIFLVKIQDEMISKE